MMLWAQMIVASYLGENTISRRGCITTRPSVDKILGEVEVLFKLSLSLPLVQYRSLATVIAISRRNCCVTIRPRS